MTLGEFAGAFNNKKPNVELELRNANNQTICRCYNNSSVIGVYENCELLDWWIMFNSGRVVVHIDDSEVFRRLEREGCL